MSGKWKWGMLFLFAMAMLFPMAAWASFSMTNPSVSGTGSGNSMGTATITSEGPWDIQEPGFDGDATVTPSGTAISFQQSHAIAWDGTANASTSGTISETGSGAAAGDSVTATTSGSTSATAQKENDPVRAQLWNEATSRLLAAGGGGAVLSRFFNTTTGFMTVDSSVEAEATGSIDATAGNDASGSSKGSATVAYTFAGRGSAETLNLTSANVAATADVDDDTTVDSPSFGHGEANAGGVLGWTDSPTTGQALGAFLNLDSETVAYRFDRALDNGLPASTANAAGNLTLSFVYRPIANPVFSMSGNVTGSTDSEAEVTEGNGIVEAQGIKAAVGTTGTQTGLPTGALAWVAGNVRMEANFQTDGELFGGYGEGHAVNPAVLGQSAVDPDPSMTVGSQYGTFSAAMGSSSLVNAEVLATAEADNLFELETVISSAFAFAAAFSENNDTTATIGAPAVELYDLAGPYAFVGQGSVTGADVGLADMTVSTTAQVLNMFGTASSPGYTGTLSNGDSSASIGLDDNDVYQRASSAGADSVTGTNYPVAIAHNQMFGTFNTDGGSPWFDIFYSTEPRTGADGVFDHLAGAFIGGGGD